MRKAKLLIRVGKKAGKRLLRGDLSYKSQSLPTLMRRATHYGATFGPKALLKKIKQEIVSIDRRFASDLIFPNGMMAGVSAEAIQKWYAKSARPVTVVVPSYNDLNVLVPCLESLEQTTDVPFAQIIVVDDYCQPEHRKKLAKLESERIKIVYREKNGGFAKAVNTGLKAANKEHDVVLINSDIVAHTGWLEALQFGAYKFDTKTGIVGAKLLYPDGRIQHAGAYRNPDAPEYFDHYYRFQDSNYGPANIPQYCMAVTGACMYVKRNFLDSIGLLDEGFQFAGEDVDWCLRGWDAGYRTLYFPAATLTHVESATRAKNKQITEKEKASTQYFLKKWEDWFDQRNVRDAKGRIRIIFVLQTLGVSGGIKIVFEQARRLADRGFAIEIWGLDAHKPMWESGLATLRTFKDYDAMSKALEPEEAIKVATWWETAFPVWLASVKNGIPVYFIQEIETWFYPDDVMAQASVIACYRKEFRNMTTSQYNLEELSSLGIPATAIPCGYDTEIYKPIKSIPRLDDVVLGVGRRFFQKNFDMTLSGWQLLGRKRPRMWLYGAEPDMTKLDTKISYFEKPNNEKVNELFNQATVFVQTSRHEGFSLPPLEAMAAGCPVVCTDAHGNRDFCVDGKNCIIVKQDNAADLSKALETILADSKLRERLSKEGIKTAKNYEWDAITDRIEVFYKDIAKI